MTKQLDKITLRVLDAISQGIIPGNELLWRTGIADRTVLFEAIMILLKYNLIAATPSVYFEKQIRTTIFSTMPSRQGYVRQILMNKYK